MTNQSKYLTGLPVNMSDAGLETLLKVYLYQTGVNKEVMEEHFLNSKLELHERLIRSILMNVIHSMNNNGAGAQDTNGDDNENP